MEKFNMSTNLKYNMNYIKMCEDFYSSNNGVTKGMIHKFYKDYLKIGEGKQLTFYIDIRNNLLKLSNLINSEEFKLKYGHEFNIVDMYLTTNLQVRDLFENYTTYINGSTMKEFLLFVKKNLMEVDNIYSCRNLYKSGSKMVYSARFFRPTKKGIDKILDLNFINYNSLDASLDDVNKAHEILLDLNQKYGVKYDDISLYIILRSYLNGEIESYYKLAEENKEELDKHSHVQKRCIPLLTRREKNLY